MRRAEAGSRPQREAADAIIINPAGFSFTSAGIMDAIKAFEGPVCEVHISNSHAPGECQRHSKPSPTGVICALGPYGYITAIQTTAQMKRFAIDSRSDRGAYFSSGGYDPLLAPLCGVR
jgi:3-dehydroquinate dehydratase